MMRTLTPAAASGQPPVPGGIDRLQRRLVIFALALGLAACGGGGGGADGGDPILAPDGGGTPPPPPAAPIEPIDVTSYYQHSMALRSDGSIWAWGRNQFGQIGDGTKTTRPSPVRLTALPALKAVATGDGFSLAVAQDGSVWTWGDNSTGQLGTGNLNERALPAAVAGFGGAKRVRAGNGHSYALKDDGTVWAWGLNGNGQLGDGTTTDRLLPVQVAGLSDIVDIRSGDYHGLALRSDGTVWAWGTNFYGQLGNGGTADSVSQAQAVPGITTAVSIAAGDGHSLAALADGTVRAWGRNGAGQLGDGTTVDRPSPVLVPTLSAVSTVRSASLQSFAHIPGVGWRAWGLNSDAILGSGLPAGQIETPVPLTVAGAGVKDIVPSYDHTIAVKEDGSILSWGVGSHGRLGNGSTNDSAQAVPVSF